MVARSQDQIIVGVDRMDFIDIRCCKAWFLLFCSHNLNNKTTNNNGTFSGTDSQLKFFFIILKSHQNIALNINY